MKLTEKHFFYLYNENMVTYQPKKKKKKIINLAERKK